MNPKQTSRKSPENSFHKYDEIENFDEDQK
jgi:hypothetical protein